MHASPMGAFLSCGVLWGRGGENATRGKVFAMARGTWVRGGVFSDTTGRRGMAFLRHSLRRKHGQWARVFPGGFLSVTREGESVRRAASGAAGGVASARGAGTAVRLCRAMEQAALRKSRRAAGWACPAGRSSRRSTSIRHPRKEAPSPCPAAFARRKGKCRTAAPPPASRRRGPCGEIPHSRPRAARPPWKTARAGIRKPPIRQSGPVRGRFWGGAGKTPGLLAPRAFARLSCAPRLHLPHPRPSAASVARETASFSAMRACRRS